MGIHFIYGDVFKISMMVFGCIGSTNPDRIKDCFITKPHGATVTIEAMPTSPAGIENLLRGSENYPSC
jgi:hypothetical protein